MKTLLITIFHLNIICFLKQCQSFTHPTKIEKEPYLLLKRSSVKNSNLNNDSNSEDSLLQTALEKQINALKEREKIVEENWKTANCESSVPIVISNDWIRRIAIQYPLVAFGTARGSIQVGNLASKKILAVSSEECSHEAYNAQHLLALSYLYGQFDGGGIIALDFCSLSSQGDENNYIIVSSGREGGVKVWSFIGDDGSIQHGGSINYLKNSFVSCMKILEKEEFELEEKKLLWVGCFSLENQVQCFDITSTELPLALQKPRLQCQVDSQVVCIDVKKKFVVCGTARGYIHLISSETGQLLDSMHVFTESEQFVRSVAILEYECDKYCIVCGGPDGAISVYYLKNFDNQNQRLAFDRTRKSLKLTSHSGAVVTLTERSIKSSFEKVDSCLLVSGAQDGSIRVWDFCHYLEGDENRIHAPKLLYQLVGYKVWLGSVCIDSHDKLRIVSDGCDNTILLHDFSNSQNNSK